MRVGGAGVMVGYGDITTTAATATRCSLGSSYAWKRRGIHRQQISMNRHVPIDEQRSYEVKRRVMMVRGTAMVALPPSTSPTLRRTRQASKRAHTQRGRSEQRCFLMIDSKQIKRRTGRCKQSASAIMVQRDRWVGSMLEMMMMMTGLERCRERREGKGRGKSSTIATKGYFAA